MLFNIQEGPLSAGSPKPEALDCVETELIAAGFELVETIETPWGVEIKIRDDQTIQVLETFFDGQPIPPSFLVNTGGPKILLLQEGCRLSWHYHERKLAILAVLRGRVSSATSVNNDQPAVPDLVPAGTLLMIPPLIRHRLASRAGWAILAEIGHHVFPDAPFDDADTIRIEDDYGRV